MVFAASSVGPFCSFLCFLGLYGVLSRRWQVRLNLVEVGSNVIVFGGALSGARPTPFLPARSLIFRPSTFAFAFAVAVAIHIIDLRRQ